MGLDRIGFTLHRLGVSSAYQGYLFIKDALMIMLDNAEFREKTLKVLYAEIAKLHNCSVSAVERNIRTCIENSWNKVSYETIDETFGSTLNYEEDRPTNREYILNLFDYLKDNENK